MLTEIFLGCLVVIKICNLIIRIMKVIPPEEPPINEEIRKKMYS